MEMQSRKATKETLGTALTDQVNLGENEERHAGQRNNIEKV